MKSFFRVNNNPIFIYLFSIFSPNLGSTMTGTRKSFFLLNRVFFLFLVYTQKTKEVDFRGEIIFGNAFYISTRCAVIDSPIRLARTCSRILEILYIYIYILISCRRDIMHNLLGRCLIPKHGLRFFLCFTARLLWCYFFLNKK